MGWGEDDRTALNKGAECVDLARNADALRRDEATVEKARRVKAPQESAKETGTHPGGEPVCLWREFVVDLLQVRHDHFLGSAERAVSIHGMYGERELPELFGTYGLRERFCVSPALFVERFAQLLKEDFFRQGRQVAAYAFQTCAYKA